MQRSPSGRPTAVRSGLLTGLSAVAVNAASAVAGVLLARKYGHGAQTDGFFAAYAVYISLVLVANALRVVVLPEFARAHVAGSLGREFGSWASALAVVIVPAVAVVLAAPHAIAGLLTGNDVAQESAAKLLPWLIPAAGAQVYAGLAASALAALDDYGTAALGYALGSVAAVVVIVAFIDHGVVVFGWGIAANGVVSLGIPLAVLLSHRIIAAPGRAVLHRLRLLVDGVALPFALQGLYLIAYRFASNLGSGRPTTFSYAYLIASLLVALTATSIALVSSVPLARSDLTPEGASRHIVSATWISLAIVAGAAGVFAVAGGWLAKLFLGSSYGGGTGAQLGRLVAYLSPWMVASAALSVAFPLIFVRGRGRWLPLLAIAALGLQVLVEWPLSKRFGLGGVAAGMAVTTAAILTVLLLALHALRAGASGVLLAAASCAAPAIVGFGLAAAFLDPVPAAVVGYAIYLGALTAWRPSGLVSSWSYLRHLA
jgi:O-antigen/teichoic acid export membrane protein